MDYKELIKSLRICGKDTGCKECMNYDPHAESIHSYDPNIMCIDDLMIRAADVIEKLNQQLEEYRKYDSFLAVHGCFDTVELPKPEPPKGEI